MAKQPKESQNFDLLSEVQNRAALQIAMGRTGRSVAAELGVNEATLSGWRQSPEFRARVNEILKDAQSAIRNKLSHAGNIAIDVLIKVMSSPTSSDRDKLTAAQAVLNIVAPSPATPGPVTGREIIETEARAAQEEQLWASLL
jgi:hypothetical protein